MQNRICRFNCRAPNYTVLTRRRRGGEVHLRARVLEVRIGEAEEKSKNASVLVWFAN